MKLCCLYDKKTTEHSCLAVLPNVDVFKRSVATELKICNPNSILVSCPHDFDLYVIGEFNVKTGVIDPCHEFICCAAELKEEQ